MAVNEKKDMGASVLARLKKQSRDTELNYQSCLQLFAQEKFLKLKHLLFAAKIFFDFPPGEVGSCHSDYIIFGERS